VGEPGGKKKGALIENNAVRPKENNDMAQLASSGKSGNGEECQSNTISIEEKWWGKGGTE